MPQRRRTLTLNKSYSTHFVNEYNFVRASDLILRELGWATGKKVEVTLDVQNGALIVKKLSSFLHLHRWYGYAPTVIISRTHTLS